MLLTCLFTADVQLPEHQSGYCADGRHQPHGLRSSCVAGRNAAHDPTNDPTHDANTTLVYAVYWPRRERRLRANDQSGERQRRG